MISTQVRQVNAIVSPQHWKLRMSSIYVSTSSTIKTESESNLERMVSIFVDIESSKCVKCVCERKSLGNAFFAEHWKEMWCLNDCIEVDDREMTVSPLSDISSSTIHMPVLSPRSPTHENQKWASHSVAHVSSISRFVSVCTRQGSGGGYLKGRLSVSSTCGH